MGYMDKALKSRDPRYARILGSLGYNRRDMQAAPITDEEIEDEKPVKARKPKKEKLQVSAPEKPVKAAEDADE